MLDNTRAAARLVTLFPTDGDSDHGLTSLRPGLTRDVSDS